MYHGEKFNSISHFIGAVLAQIGFGALITIGIQQNDWATLISFTTFGLTLVILYAMSTLYHSFEIPQLKRFFQKLDHVSIYFLIAGTYTPYMMVSLGDGNGPLMLVGIWGLALFGFLLDIFISERNEILQNCIYISMGWICLLEFDHLQEAIAPPGILLLVAGGIAYTGGIIFYVLDHHKKLNHAHGIWHLFVMAGSISHFISVIGYVR